MPTVGGRSNIKNEDLTWETSSQTNVGLDFALLNNRLSLSLDYYYKYTKDMLMSVPLPSPYPNITRNDGEMSNQGFEITLSSVNIARKDFNWSTDLNVSLNRNKVEKLNLKQVYYYATTSDATNDNVVRMTPGHPLSMFWGYVSKGVDPETGDLVYEDRNGDGKVVVTLNVYTLDYSDTETQTESAAYLTMAGTTKLATDVQGGLSSVFLLWDPAGFEESTGSLRYLDGTLPAADSDEDWWNMVYKWDDCPVLAGLDLGDYGPDTTQSRSGSNQEYMSQFYVGMRGAWNSGTADNLSGGEEFWQKLTEGAASTAAPED